MLMICGAINIFKVHPQRICIVGFTLEIYIPVYFTYIDIHMECEAFRSEFQLSPLQILMYVSDTGSIPFFPIPFNSTWSIPIPHQIINSKFDNSNSVFTAFFGLIHVSRLLLGIPTPSCLYSK